MLDLFADERPWQEPLAEGAVILRRQVRADAEFLLQHIQCIADQYPFVHRTTPRGYRMSVAMTQSGQAGWLSGSMQNRSHSTRLSTPFLPLSRPLQLMAMKLATLAGYPDFVPDNCLVNRYVVDSKLSLHQDKEESDLTAPIVSISLGLPAVFLFGGLERSDMTRKVLLEHGDVVVWGGASRLCFHGIQPLKSGSHPLTGAYRYNMTFRRAG